MLAMRPSLDERVALLRRSTSNSGFYGVTKERKDSSTRPYLAQIRRGTRQVKLGRFETAEDAAAAYAEAMDDEDVEKLCEQSESGTMTSEQALAQA